MTFPVELYVYDLSKGMAKMMSLPLTGKQFDGIWHTSIVVHETEHYFSQGLNSIAPLSSEHGILVKKMSMGNTSMSAIEVAALIHGMESKYTVESYHIITNNCNHFTDEMLKILCDAQCPAEIMSLAGEVMATPFGAMVKPLFESMFVGKRKTVDQEAMRSTLDGMMKKDEADVVFSALHSALDQ